MKLLLLDLLRLRLSMLDRGLLLGKLRRRLLRNQLSLMLLLLVRIVMLNRSLACKKNTCTEKDIFAEKDVKYVPSEQRKADQKTVDDEVLNAIKVHPTLSLPS
ncbi:hypothetical protein pipiens_011171 [Culex pipiens pipiens]|uniref:Uncharacterized protein n=1 Tax=Culex pipiens pipiens TaxID=38569 RepID=A0ABD1D859_CULPP